MFKGIRHIFLLLLSAAGLLTGCVIDSAPEDTPQEIQFQVSTAAPTPATRVTTIDNNVELMIRDIRIDAYFNGTTTALFSNAMLRYYSFTSHWAFYNGGWIQYYWPIEGSIHATAGTVSSIDFVGYVPYNYNEQGYTALNINDYSASNGPSFSATLPSSDGTFDETDQAPVREFMYAYVTNQTKDTNGGTVDMQFRHPFALVNIYLKSAKLGTVINSVQLSGINTSGTFTYSSGWGLQATPATLSKTVGKTVPGQLNFNALIGGPYMVIPQTLSGENNLTVNRTLPNEGPTPVSTTLAPTWLPGMIYNYYLDLGKDDGRILVDVVIEPWQTHTVPTIDVK